MTTYTTTGGRVLNYDDSSPRLAAFLARVHAASLDNSITTDDMILLVYGPDNPLLDPTILPGRYMVTPVVFANPIHHVLNDLLFLKGVRLGRVDMEKAHSRFTISIPDAAKQLGVTGQALRSAIESYRLSAIFKNGQWWTSPQAVATFKVSKAGRPKKRKSPTEA